MSVIPAYGSRRIKFKVILCYTANLRQSETLVTKNNTYRCFIHFGAGHMPDSLLLSCSPTHPHMLGQGNFSSTWFTDGNSLESEQCLMPSDW